MRRTLIALSLFPLLLCAAAPASAATAEQKKETCTFGADDAKLEGAKPQCLHGQVHVEPRTTSAVRWARTGDEKAPALKLVAHKPCERRRLLPPTRRTPHTPAKNLSLTPLSRWAMLQRRHLVSPQRSARRSTSISIARPMRSALSTRIRSSTPVTGTPSARTMVSSVIRPALAAGAAFGSSPVTISARGHSRCRRCALCRRGTAAVCLRHADKAAPDAGRAGSGYRSSTNSRGVRWRKPRNRCPARP